MDITGANAVLMLTVPPLFTVPQQIQGFAADDVYSFGEIESVETLMGVDGFLSGGFVWKPQMQTITLQADSPSNALFDTWYGQQAAAQGVYVAQGIISIPSIGLKFIQTIGYLRQYKLPDVKKLVQPRRFGIEWQQVVAARI